MKKIEKLHKEINNILASASILKDTSFRRRGGYFGTETPSFNKSLLLKVEARTRHLNNYYIAADTHQVDRYNSLIQKLNDIREAERQKTQRAIDRKNKRIEAADTYNLIDKGWAHMVELSDRETYGKYFSVEKLAKTLDISVEDANLLRSGGKTYVFATKKDGSIIELYHASLSCNPLTIWVSFNAEGRKTEFEKERSSWVNAPYSSLVGQTTNSNHFVC